MSGKTDPEKPYLKCDGSHSVSGYLRYIGTRERVEILPDDRPPTRKQEQLITKLTKDFPEARELGEYSDYKTSLQGQRLGVYHQGAGGKLVGGAAVRRLHEVHRHPSTDGAPGDHGLFGDEDGVNLEQAMRELDQYTGNVWTHIISLKRRTPPGWDTITPRHG